MRGKEKSGRSLLPGCGRLIPLVELHRAPLFESAVHLERVAEHVRLVGHPLLDALVQGHVVTGRARAQGQAESDR